MVCLFLTVVCLFYVVLEMSLTALMPGHISSFILTNIFDSVVFLKIVGFFFEILIYRATFL